MAKGAADQSWIDRALTGDPVWDIGQIDAPTARALNKLVKQGRLIRCRGSFCGISRDKTIWCRSDEQLAALHAQLEAA